jgi:chloride channel protein, CIC family
LLAAGAGAGLATAFNAPIAGAVFVLEELMRRFDTRTTVATFGASAGAIGISGLFLGHAPDFHFNPPPYPTFNSVPIYLVLGLFAGVVGIAYNRAILGTLAVTNKIGRQRPEILAAIIGAAVGVLAWLWPESVGGGQSITQRALNGTETLRVVAFMFLLRFALGPISYAARTPGGLFSPMLALGSLTGILFGHTCAYCLPSIAPHPSAVAVVSIAALFTAVVRAPLTGIILVMELTGCATQLLPMLCACFVAMLLPTLTRDEPIYDALT